MAVAVIALGRRRRSHDGPLPGHNWGQHVVSGRRRRRRLVVAVAVAVVPVVVAAMGRSADTAITVAVAAVAVAAALAAAVGVPVRHQVEVAGTPAATPPSLCVRVCEVKG